MDAINDMDERPLVLLTGATGYIGGRLAPRLLDAGYRVRCLVRDPARLQGREWVARVELVTGDVLEPETLPAAMTGVSAAYYLIHSMAGGEDFSDRDVRAARNFGSAAAQAGVERIIYLGGLGDSDSELSHHLRSRQETGDALREGGVPVTEFRASVIVGSGSLSFEMIRYLTERLPVMICPKWVYTRTQPIAVRNVMEYLIAALTAPESAGRIIEIGGADVVTYGEMMQTYADVRGLRRAMIPVPVLTPRLSSYWVHLVTPAPAAIARPLIEGLRNEVVVQDDTAQRLFPDITADGLSHRGGTGAGAHRGAHGGNCLERCAGFESGRRAAGDDDHRRGDGARTAPTRGRRFAGGRRMTRSPGWAANAVGSTWTGRGGCAARWTG